jgi:hypothetical protein
MVSLPGRKIYRTRVVTKGNAMRQPATDSAINYGIPITSINKNLPSQLKLPLLALMEMLKDGPIQ